jgi:hypothetical protein
VNIGLHADAPFEDDRAWLEFLGAHEQAHQTIVQALARRGHVISRPSLVSDPRDDPMWLLDHGRLHAAEAAALGGSSPDLESVDLTDEIQYQDWMRLHADVHRAENAALGIY